MKERGKKKEDLIREVEKLRRQVARLRKADARHASAMELFHAAIEEAPDGVQIVDMDGSVIYSNKAVEDMYGFSHEELRGMHVNEMNVDPEFAGEAILPSIRESGRWAGELMVKHKNGTEFPIWLTTSLAKDKGGKPLAMVGVIRDMTERNRMEQEREKLISELQEALANIKTLRGLIPVCAWCRKVRDDRGYLDNLEAYIRTHTDAKITHGICPDCMSKLGLEEEDAG